VPRTSPREEQLIRARRAQALGVIDMLLPEEAADPVRLAAALKALPGRAPPSQAPVKLELDGLDKISDLVGNWFDRGSQKRFSLIEGTS
jgi:predicted glycosyltransferase